MIETVVKVGLFVDENMEIKKNRLMPSVLPTQPKRIAIVTGIYGDELEGQYVCYELIRRLNESLPLLKGIVDIYPALNPMGLASISRGIPMFDLDMNQIFPGSKDGAVAEYVASKIIEDITGADMCIDIHSSNIYLREIPQVRLFPEFADQLLPYATYLNTDFIWIHPSQTVLPATLGHSLNAIGVPTLVVETGVGMRITPAFGNRLVDGIWNLMAQLGILDIPVIPPVLPIISTHRQVALIHADTSGIFMPSVDHNYQVTEGQHIGDIVNPLLGTLTEAIYAPMSGMLFTLREYPVVYAGSLIGRIVGGETHE